MFGLKWRRAGEKEKEWSRDIIRLLAWLLLTQQHALKASFQLTCKSWLPIESIRPEDQYYFISDLNPDT